MSVKNGISAIAKDVVGDVQKEAEAIIQRRLAEFKAILQKQAAAHKDTVMIGRTHGRRAEVRRSHNFSC